MVARITMPPSTDLSSGYTDQLGRFRSLVKYSSESIYSSNHIQHN